MKIGFDLSRYFDRSAGVGVYAANLLKALARIDSRNEYVAYSFFYGCLPPNWKDRGIAQEFQEFHNIRFARLGGISPKKKWQDASIMKKEALLGDVDVMHSTAYALPELFSSRLVVTIHDLSFLIFPEFHTPENYSQVLSNLIYLNSRPEMVICDSEATKKDTIKYFHVPEQKLEVVHLGVDGIFFGQRKTEEIEDVLHKYGLSQGYLLCVSSIEPRKNFERIIRVFGQMKKQDRYRELRLVCVGGKGWKNTDIYRLVKELGLEESIIFLGYLSQKELPLVYRGAKIFLYPSLYEGFGLPVLEAMASGVPVVTSNLSSLPEVASNAAALVDPYSEKRLFEAVDGLLENISRQKELVGEGLINARKFSWEETARKTLAIYEKVFSASKEISS